jgi:hypothetical protein
MLVSHELRRQPAKTHGSGNNTLWCADSYYRTDLYPPASSRSPVSKVNTKIWHYVRSVGHPISSQSRPFATLISKTMRFAVVVSALVGSSIAY